MSDAEGELIPFQIEAGLVRGRIVRLDRALDGLIGPHHLPVAAGQCLAETALLAAALAGGLKYDGIFTLQVQADGAIPLIVADVESGGALRAYARIDEDKLSKAMAQPADMPAVARYFGKGYLAFTVDQGPDTERYQGIVALDGDTLADCAEAYLSQSEQLASALSLAVAPPAGGHGWRGGAVIIQRMPLGPTSPIMTADQADEDWNRSKILLGSLTAAELLDPALATPALLHRLFHAEGLVLHEGRALQARCRCSRERVEAALSRFSAEEMAEMKDEAGRIVATCEFCKTDYVFSDDDFR